MADDIFMRNVSPGGSVFVDHNTESPALVVKDHGTAKAALFLYAVADIKPDGKLDYPKDVLESFDFIVASVHSGLNMSEADATKRVLKAIKDPHTTILGHPTGRLLLQRDGYPLKWDKIFEACAERRVAIEINANPRRLDIDWRLIKRAKEHGVMFSIGPDAHSTEGLEDVQYGVGIARKGWLTRDDVLNCLDADAFLAWKEG